MRKLFEADKQRAATEHQLETTKLKTEAQQACSDFFLCNKLQFKDWAERRIRELETSRDEDRRKIELWKVRALPSAADDEKSDVDASSTARAKESNEAYLRKISELHRHSPRVKLLILQTFEC